MEQGQYWTMQTKRKFSLGYNNNIDRSSYDESSWEEQAFAEDAAGALVGGCIWPPRSYSCSFCRREFRSAQALGGHMNVHRRDRARLKQQQPSSPNNKNNNNNNDDEVIIQNNHPFTSLGSSCNTLLYPSTSTSTTLCGLAFKTNNPNSDLVPSASSSSLIPSPPSSSSKALLLAPPSLFPSSSILVHKNYSQVYCSQPWSNFGGDNNNNQRLCSNNKFNPEEADVDHEKISQGLLDKGKNDEEEDCDDDDEDEDVGVSLNLVVCRTTHHHQFEAKEEEHHISFKKKRKTEASSIQFLPKSTSSVDRHNHHHMHPKMIELNPNSIEELDLELRLGNCSSEV
ncbi:hypothetical protein PIB30_023536 [Stylosanthes scabra]|uniref:C2H2-type domain-containing protein n=1 Tax=Stylosanthes scabra TaxID=79078 RepID=A0ABU6V905_9FABA|nr:hypothetical protein [Stylosanthes scabra]